MNLKVNFYKSVGHRGVVAVKSFGISPRITDSDPEISGESIKEIKAVTEDGESVKTASALNKWSHQVYNIMKDHRANKFRRIPANYILLRGASCYRELKKFKDKHGLKGAVIAGSPIVKGINANKNT